MEYEHLTRVGRFTVIDTGRATEALSNGSPGITSDELSRLERRAAITVLSQIEEIEGGELKFARKAMGLKQAELAHNLGVTTGTVCRWETGKEEFKRQTRLAMLQLLEAVERNGEGTPTRPVRAHLELTLRAKAP